MKASGINETKPTKVEKLMKAVGGNETNPIGNYDHETPEHFKSNSNDLLDTVLPSSMGKVEAPDAIGKQVRADGRSIEDTGDKNALAHGFFLNSFPKRRDKRTTPFSIWMQLLDRKNKMKPLMKSENTARNVIRTMTSVANFDGFRRTMRSMETDSVRERSHDTDGWNVVSLLILRVLKFKRGENSVRRNMKLEGSDWGIITIMKQEDGEETKNIYYTVGPKKGTSKSGL